MTNQANNFHSWTCPSCGKGNPEQGRYCGGCGYFQTPPVESVMPSEESKRQKSRRQLKLYVQARKTAIRLGKRFIKREWLMALSVLLVLGFSPILALQSFGGKAAFSEVSQKVSWSVFRTHLSRALGLTLIDVDKLIILTLKNIPPENSIVSCHQAQVIKERLGELPAFSKTVFHWLPPQGDVLINYLTIPKTSGSARRFTDVPMDHPLYQAWKPLLEVGAPLGLKGKTLVETTTARPYEPVCRDEWQKILAFLQINNEKNEADSRALQAAEELLSVDQWRNSLTRAASFLGLEKNTLDGKVQANGRLSRLTAFAVLSELVAQANQAE